MSDLWYIMNIEKLKNFLTRQLWLFFRACCVSLQFLVYVPPLSILSLKWTITALHLEKVIWYGSLQSLYMAPRSQMPPIYPVFRLSKACLLLQSTDKNARVAGIGREEWIIYLNSDI